MDIFEACESGDLTIVQDAINNGADVNAKDDDNVTPLIWACEGKLSDLSELLIEHAPTVAPDVAPLPINHRAGLNTPQ